MDNQNPMQLLRQEHEIITRTGIVIKQLDKGWDVNADRYAADMETLLDFFTRYSDQYHHHKEELVLFQMLRNNPEFMLTGILDELEDHHQSFRESVRNIHEALTEKKWVEAQRILEQYFEQLQDHIAIENEELFHMAESIFQPDDLKKMYFLFEDVDRDLGIQEKDRLVVKSEEMATGYKTASGKETR